MSVEDAVAAPHPEAGPDPLDTLEIALVGPEAAAEVLDVVRAAFADRPPLDPPTEALAETVDSVGELLAGGGLLARLEGRAVAAVAFDQVGADVYLRRFGVRPQARGLGVAHRLVATAISELAGRADAERVVVLAREELPRTVGFWREHGFTEVGRSARPYIELARRLPVVVPVPTAEAMRALGTRLAAQVRAGDLLVLSGGLGAGKTTFTQGLGEGLGVRGGVTSPTFVIARVHPSLVGGPDLVHVDAYRLGGAAELDDLDLDTDLARAVTVVEWGTGLAEGLDPSRLEVRITRSVGGDDRDDPVDPVDRDEPDGDDDPRVVEVHPVGPRWLADPPTDLV